MAPVKSPPRYDDVFPALPPVETAKKNVAEGLSPYHPPFVTEVIF